MTVETVEIGDSWTQKIALAFLTWARWLKEHLPKDFLSWNAFNPTGHISSAFYEAGKAQVLSIGIAFDLRSPEAEAWISRFAASQISGIDEGSKLAIRRIVLKGFQEGITSEGQAKLIRQHIGLNARQSQALLNFSQIENITDKQIEAYGSKLLRNRALTIALTEGHTAANEGYREANRQAVKRGILDPAIYERYWMVTRDRRLCSRCQALGGLPASLPDGNFEGDGRGPPLHPRCRCTEGIRKIA